MLSHNERAEVCDGQPGGKVLHSSYQIWKTTEKTSFRLFYWLKIRKNVSLGLGELFHLNAGGDSVQREINVLPKKNRRMGQARSVRYFFKNMVHYDLFTC